MSETVAMTLSEFLLARIAEDEAAARRGQSPPTYDHHGESAWEECYDMAEGEGCSGEGVAFIAHMSPARVLAECEAKRAVIEAAHLYGAPGMCETGWSNGQGCNVYDMFLSTMAAVYADHRDYREEWKP